jgi:glycerophosphoryl diester phosphodiesterase
VIPHYRLVDEALLRQLRDAGRKILVWTVNAPAEMRHLAEAGVDGMISDNTSLLFQTLAE